MGHMQFSTLQKTAQEIFLEDLHKFTTLPSNAIPLYLVTLIKATDDK